MPVSTDVVREFKGSVVEAGKDYAFDHPLGRALARAAEAKAVADYYAGTEAVEDILSVYSSSLTGAYKKYNADQVLTGLRGGINPYLATGIGALEADIQGISGVDPTMVPIALNRAKDRIADAHVDQWLQSSADSLETALTTLNSTPGKIDEGMATRIRATAEKKLTERFESHKRAFEAGLMSDTEFEGLISSTRNPHLKTLLEKYWNTDETRAKKKKDAAFNAVADPLATSFEGEFENVDYSGSRVDFDSLTTMVENSPGYSSLPDPVKKAVEISMKHSKRRGELNQEIDELSKKEAKGKEDLARLERTKLLTKIWSKRIAFIAGGMLIGGLLGFGGTSLVASSLSLPGWLTTGLGASSVAGGVYGGATLGALAGVFESKFTKAGIERKNTLIGLDKKIKEAEIKVEDIEDGFVKKDISAQVAYTKLAARLAAMTHNLDAEAMVEKYMKKTNLAQLEAILA